VKEFVEKRSHAIARYIHQRHVAVEYAVGANDGVQSAPARFNRCAQAPQIVYLGGITLNDQPLIASSLVSAAAFSGTISSTAISAPSRIH
jgi:hypothetical protein